MTHHVCMAKLNLNFIRDCNNKKCNNDELLHFKYLIGLVIVRLDDNPWSDWVNFCFFSYFTFKGKFDRTAVSC